MKLQGSVDTRAIRETMLRSLPFIARTLVDTTNRREAKLGLPCTRFGDNQHTSVPCHNILGVVAEASEIYERPTENLQLFSIEAMSCSFPMIVLCMRQEGAITM